MTIGYLTGPQEVLPTINMILGLAFTLLTEHFVIALLFTVCEPLRCLVDDTTIDN